MKLSRRARLILAMPLVPAGALALLLWGIGWAIMSGGQSLWMTCHKLLRDPGCACGECVEFDGAVPKAPEPPAAA